MPIVSQDKCESVYENNMRESQICAGEAGKGPCTVALVGILTYGIAKCASEPDVYTRLSSYMTWLKQNIKP